MKPQQTSEFSRWLLYWLRHGLELLGVILVGLVVWLAMMAVVGTIYFISRLLIAAL